MKEEHLVRHLLGRQRDGLLFRLMEEPVRYSLTHGDLHPLNVLADSENVWLLDFGETGVAPTLFDFAKLEVYMRLWCLELAPGGRNFESAAMEFETLLLDNMMRTESNLEEVRTLAPCLGASSESLLNVARCIALIRSLAPRYSTGGPDRRDYLAVLFLTVLNTLQFAGKTPDETENNRLLVSLFWLLEDMLSTIHGMEPYGRGRAAFKPTRLVSRSFLAAPGAPARVLYLMDRPDGQAALAPLAATRGVLQSQKHHLDVFDHTLLVLATLEELLRDPVGGLLDPPALERRVQDALKTQGVRLLPAPVPLAVPDEPALPDFPADLAEKLRRLLGEVLDCDTQVLLKWVALFHDVGKPATRAMSVGPRGYRERVQFLGHEVYGQQLTADHARDLFPDEAQRARFERLIRKHHVHHNMTERYLDPKRLDPLRRALSTCELPPSELRYLSDHMSPTDDGDPADFPLLILHGFADSLACRGPEAETSATRMAEIDLVLLGLYLRFPSIRHRQVMEERFREQTKGMDEVLGISGPLLGKVLKDLKDWYLERVIRESAGDAGFEPPTRSELEEQAGKILKSMV